MRRAGDSAATNVGMVGKGGAQRGAVGKARIARSCVCASAVIARCGRGGKHCTVRLAGPVAAGLSLFRLSAEEDSLARRGTKRRARTRFSFRVHGRAPLGFRPRADPWMVGLKLGNSANPSPIHRSASSVDSLPDVADVTRDDDNQRPDFGLR